jgi:tetratricopeptide (TPR) repeat protein
MKFYNILIKYRLPLGILAIVLAVVVNLTSGFWPSFLLYFIGVIAIASHFFIGPLRLVQSYMEEGDFDGADKVLQSVWFPNLLIKPMRSTYYQIKSYVAMSKKDNVAAEAHMRTSLKIGSPMKEAEGPSYLQLGSLAMQRGDMKQGEEYIRMALKAGLPDKDSKAMAHLQLVSAYAQKKQYRAAKDHFKKAEDLNPTNPEIVSQIKQIKKSIGRMPG